MVSVEDIGKVIKMQASGQSQDDIKKALLQEGLSETKIDEIFQDIANDELLKVTGTSFLPGISKTTYTFGMHSILINKEYLTGISQEKTSIAIETVESVLAVSDLSGNSAIIKQQSENNEIKIENITIADMENIQTLYKYIMEAQKLKPKS